MQDDWSKDCKYRVTIKALIRNQKGEILMVDEPEEIGGQYSLPGGGYEYGESAHDCLKRELQEEIALKTDFKERLIHQQSRPFPGTDTWIMWLTYEITYDELDFSVGKDAADVKWVSPDQINDQEMLGQMVLEVLRSEKEWAR